MENGYEQEIHWKESLFHWLRKKINLNYSLWTYLWIGFRIDTIKEKVKYST